MLSTRPATLPHIARLCLSFAELLKSPPVVMCARSCDAFRCCTNNWLHCPAWEMCLAAVWQTHHSRLIHQQKWIKIRQLETDKVGIFMHVKIKLVSGPMVNIWVIYNVLFCIIYMHPCINEHIIVFTPLLHHKIYQYYNHFIFYFKSTEHLFTIWELGETDLQRALESSKSQTLTEAVTSNKGKRLDSREQSTVQDTVHI